MTTGILYLTFNALSEPLGQSQIFPYILENSSKYRFTIVSLEKESFLDNKSLNEIKKQCVANSINWRYGRFVPKPFGISTFLNLVKVLYFSFKELATNKDISVIHCRSYIPAYLGVVLGAFFKKKVIFDMRGLWIEELVASHSIKYRGALYKILSFFERKTLKSASKIITLTYKSKEYISETYGIDKSKVVVIPTCVDLVTFLPSIKPLRKERIRFVVLGTVLSGWFRFDMLLDFMMIISKNFQEAQFSIFTADSKKDIKQKIAESNYYFHNLDINICYKKRKELALELNHFDFGVMFYNSTNLCEIARSPTKIGELLASGVPIIINQGIGDIDALLSCNEVGLCINEEHFQLQGQIQNKITNLINNSSIRKTCREVALKTYSVREGSEKYSNCYQSLSYSK